MALSNSVLPEVGGPTAKIVVTGMIAHRQDSAGSAQKVPGYESL